MLVSNDFLHDIFGGDLFQCFIDFLGSGILDINKSNAFLVGGFNPSEKYLSNWIISPGRDENKKSLKPPPSSLLFKVRSFFSLCQWLVGGGCCFPRVFSLHIRSL